MGYLNLKTIPLFKSFITPPFPSFKQVSKKAAIKGPNGAR
jgi:hypothetical protein